MKITLYLPRQLRWPITWGTACGSLGLALLAGWATTSSTAGSPDHSQVVVEELASPTDNTREAEGDDAAADADDADNDDEPVGKVRINGLAPPDDDELPAGTVRIRNDRSARSSISAWTRKALTSKDRAPKAQLARRAPRSKCVTPLDQRPPNMTVAAPDLPADPQGEAEDPDELDDNEVPPGMALEPGEEAADDVADAAADEAELASQDEDPAFITLADDPPLVALSSAGQCPPTEENLDALVNGMQQVDAYDLLNRKPIGTLRADMRMRLPNKHSILWNLREKPADNNEESQLAATRERVLVHENVRCLVENERQAIRAHYKETYGPYFDRSRGGGCDENVAPVFPYTYCPLYFEDPNLERCGHSLGCCVQPFASLIHFYGNVALFPVKAVVLRPWECVYPQADCEPCTRYSCLDNILGPCPETIGWGCFKSRRYSCRTCNGQTW